MTTLEALQGMERALERVERCFPEWQGQAARGALADWRSRTPLVADADLVLRVAARVFGESHTLAEFSRAADAVEIIDSLLASPTERTKP